MTCEIFNITFDSVDPWRAGQFWSAVLDRPLGPDDQPEDDEIGIPLDTGGQLIFQRVPESKVVKNRMHLCLRPGQRRDDEVRRLLDLGAALVDDRRNDDGTGWAVLGDPEGNEFCVLRSAAERTG